MKSWRSEWMKFVKSVHRVAEHMGGGKVHVALIYNSRISMWVPRVQIDELSEVVKSGRFMEFERRVSELATEFAEKVPRIRRSRKINSSNPYEVRLEANVYRGASVGFGFPSIPGHEKRWWEW